MSALKNYSTERFDCSLDSSLILDLEFYSIVLKG